MVTKINVAVIGCGYISDRYLCNIKGRYSRSLNLACVSDEDEKMAVAAAEKYSTEFKTLDEVLGDPVVDVIINLTPPLEHLRINKAALEAGKHVYSEAPLANSFEAVRNLQALAEEKGLLLCCGPDTFYGPTWQTARKMLDGGWIGKPLFAYANVLNAGEALWHPDAESYFGKMSGMLGGGVRLITALVALLGPVDSLMCFGRRRDENPNSPFEHYIAALTFENGIIVNVTVGHTTWLSMMPSFEVHGENGSIFLPDPQFYYVKDDMELFNTFTPSRVMRGERMLEAIEGEDGLRANEIILGADVYARAQPLIIPYHTSEEPLEGWCVAEMAHVLKNGGKCRASGDFAAHCAEVMFAFDISAETGCLCKISSTCIRPEEMPEATPIGEFAWN